MSKEKVCQNHSISRNDWKMNCYFLKVRVWDLFCQVHVGGFTYERIYQAGLCWRSQEGLWLRLHNNEEQEDDAKEART
jgi:hypothetical protein